MRFELRTGKFGQYFHDTSNGKDLSLSDVLNLLNQIGQLSKTLTDIDRALSFGMDEEIWPPGSTRGEAIEKLHAVKMAALRHINNCECGNRLPSSEQETCDDPSCDYCALVRTTRTK